MLRFCLALFATLMLTTGALAQTPAPADTTTPAPPDTTMRPDSLPPPPAPPGRDSLGAPPATTPPVRHPGLGAVRSRGASVEARERRTTESRLDSLVRAVDAHADSAGADSLVSRLQREFGTLADSAATWRATTGLGWGELVIATTLAANAPDSLRLGVTDFAALRAEGMGWGQIAHGMGFSLGSLVAAAQTEARAMRGIATADGRIARIAPAPPVKAPAARPGNRRNNR
jgi:hypothetical protein